MRGVLQVAKPGTKVEGGRGGFEERQGAQRPEQISLSGVEGAGLVG